MASILEWQEKHRIKLTFIALGLLAIFILAVFLGSGGNEEQLSEATNIEEAKSAVDYFINSWEQQYRELCDGPKNGTTKEKFSELSQYIRTIEEAGEKCVKLDGEIQMKVQEYAREQIKKYPHLLALSDYGTIECW
jgi:hypothetical protein